MAVLAAATVLPPAAGCFVDAGRDPLIKGETSEGASDSGAPATKGSTSLTSSGSSPGTGTETSTGGSSTGTMVDCDGKPQYEWYPDGDGDGFGLESTPVLHCVQPDGYAPEIGDCDDLDPDTYPGADEHCDGHDDDCDGLVDEWSEQNTASCFGCQPYKAGFRTYWFCDDNQDWNLASDRCAEKGAQLVIFETLAENEILPNAAPDGPNNYWIGLSNPGGEEGVFGWVNGMKLGQLGVPNWREGQPDEDPMNGPICVFMDLDLDADWFDSNCVDHKYSYICEAAI